MRKTNKEASSTPWWAANSKLSTYSTNQVRTHSAGAIAVTLLLGSIVFFLVFLAFANTNPTAPKKSEWGSVEHPVSVQAVIAQCGNIFTFDAADEHYGTYEAEAVPDSGVPQHPMIVPAYGFMSQEGLAEDKPFYGADEVLETPAVLRSLYAGKTIIWYDPSRVSESYAAEMRVQLSSSEDVIIAPWNYEREIPRDRRFAFSSWRVTMSCMDWNPQVFEEYLTFLHEHPEFAPSDPENPPAAPLTNSGKLFEIRPNLVS